MEPKPVRAASEGGQGCLASPDGKASWLHRLPGPTWIWIAGLIVAVVFWGFADVRLRGLPWLDRPLEHKTDFTVYTVAGAAFFDGRPPYDVANPRGWKYCYPPLFAILVAPLSVLRMEDQVLVWYFISVLFCWGCYRESARIAAAIRRSNAAVNARFDQWFPRLGAMAFAAALFPTFNCLQRGQVGVLKLYLLLLGLRLVLDARTWRGRTLGGVALAAPIVLKLTPALPVAILLGVQLWGRLPACQVDGRKARPAGRPLARRFGPLVATASGVALGLVLFVLIVPAALVGWNANLGHLRTWSDHVLTAADSVAVADRPDGQAKTAPETNPYGGNHRTVRNQSLANGMFRMAAWADYTFCGGPNDRPLDDDLTAETRVDTPAYGRAQMTARVAVLAAMLLAVACLGWGGDRLGQATAFGLGCVGILAFSPISWGHYYMLLAPAVLTVPLWLDRQGRPRAAVVMAVVPAVLSVLHYVAMKQVGRLGLLGLGTSVWLVTASCLVVVSFRRVPAGGVATGEGVANGDRPHPNPLPTNLRSVPGEGTVPRPKYADHRRRVAP